MNLLRATLQAFGSRDPKGFPAMADTKESEKEEFCKSNEKSHWASRRCKQANIQKVKAWVARNCKNKKLC